MHVYNVLAQPHRTIRIYIRVRTLMHSTTHAHDRHTHMYTCLFTQWHTCGIHAHTYVHAHIHVHPCTTTTYTYTPYSAFRHQFAVSTKASGTGDCLTDSWQQLGATLDPQHLSPPFSSVPCPHPSESEPENHEQHWFWIGLNRRDPREGHSWRWSDGLGVRSGGGGGTGRWVGLGWRWALAGA